MKNPGPILLLIDAAINLVLGVLLMAFFQPLSRLLGVPLTDVSFYPTLLGAVLFGIGIALVIEWRRPPQGLGLGGAAAINLSGGTVLLFWLFGGELDLPRRGSILLGSLAVLLVVLSVFELSSRYRNPTDRRRH